jgi:signal peptidase I
MSRAKNSQKVATMLLKWFVRLILLALVAIVAGAVVLVVVLPRATHGSAMTVLTGSMTPTIPVGSVVLVRPVDTGTLRVGDVATYQPKAGKAEFITHRVLKIDESTSPAQFIFKGDANRGADIDPVSAEQIRGKVWFHVPYLGAIRDGLHGKGGFTLLAMLFLIGYAISQLSNGLKERRRKSATFSIDRPVVVAIVDKAALAAGMQQSVVDAAGAWSALIVQEDEETATLVLTPPPNGLSASLELLRLSEPRRLLVVDDGNLVGPYLHETNAASPIISRKERDDAVL